MAESIRHRNRRLQKKANNKRATNRDRVRIRGVIVCCVCGKKRTHKKGVGGIWGKHAARTKDVQARHDDAQAFRKVYVRSTAGKKATTHSVCIGYACPNCWDERSDGPKARQAAKERALVAAMKGEI